MSQISLESRLLCLSYFIAAYEYTRRATGQLCENTTSTKPEVHIRFVTPPQRSRASATGNMHKNLMKFGRVVFQLCERTDRHTDILITILRIPSNDDVIIKKYAVVWTCSLQTNAGSASRDISACNLDLRPVGVEVIAKLHFHAQRIIRHIATSCRPC